MRRRREGPQATTTNLEVTSRVIVGTDERGGASEEGVGSSSDNDALGLSLLADRRREALVSNLLALRKRLSGETGLVDRDSDGVEEAAVGGDDVANLEGDHVSRDKVGRVDFVPDTAATALGLGGERLHEGLDSVTSGALLVEADSRVDEQEKDDSDEILPIGGLASTVRESNGDEGGSLHDPGEGVPHEAV
jgi:hypothetical protein